MLFNRYFLQSFGLGQITLYAPSSREEYEKGYDAKLTNSQSFNEIYLQFKRPRLKGNQFLLSTSIHQHKNLQKRPPNSCYYVGHTFRDLQEFERAQRDARTWRDFLKYFVLIEISCLDPNLTTIAYQRNEKSLLPRTVLSEGKTRISSKRYFTGTVFRDAFSRQEVGAYISLTAEGELSKHARTTQIGSAKAEDFSLAGLSKAPRQIWYRNPAMMKAISAVGSQAEGKRGNFGSLYRMPTK